ncbi:Sec-independent protein translocase protein TatB [Campylobacter lanienae]|uniref:Sec-independent protein translocase protein TatB n=1 Tax=Campylobacter lanienae TaxID=75658 RepID=UPI00243319EB|nr:Sec-independent protein translocase protein TatB [Campylobacter lanienae]MDD7514674.1 Sec-independent protein translocase protein TatB [Campylobacter lanienae]MDY5519887.1 Sec-independent protein translocase protein TatB [Campylobacter lanienae]
MFGMGISEIIIIAVIAVIVLGPDKLPSAMVNIAKFFKVFKQTINGAKSTFEQEIKIAELKEDAKKYKDSLTTSIDGVRKKLTLEELDELKSSVNSISQTTQKSLADIQNEISNLNPIDKLNAGLDLETQSQDRSQTAKNLAPNPQITNTIPNELSKDQIQKEA